MGEEFFRQLTAEQLITRVVKGYRKPEWVKTRERNEALDTRIYARAAAAHYGLDRFAERHWKALESMVRTERSAEPSAAAAQSGFAAAVAPPASGPTPSRGLGRSGSRRVIRSPFLNY